MLTSKIVVHHVHSMDLSVTLLLHDGQSRGASYKLDVRCVCKPAGC